jgi:anaerobic ribonucleoside-triphosphate reductase
MSLPHRARGLKVLKAVSSPLRLQILNLLFDKSALSYTELMNALKMNPSRDAGKFAYHLKFLLKTNLVEADADSKKYYLTDLGKMIIDVADRVEKKALKPKGMLVRTSHSTLEEFDANKIANSLIREAKMPPDQAQKAAKEAEKLLLKSKTKYLTAPLVREVVNAILIENGQEDYRHKLTRLGLPVHEVTALIEAKDNLQGAASMLTKAGTTVLSEYTLLNVFPRDIADAHTSGAIHVNGLGTWLLKPNEVMHDIRFFLQNGLKTLNPLQLSERPPETFESALSLAFSVLLHSSSEINELQTLDYFNVFLAPYIKDVNSATVKENLRLFIRSLNHHVDAAICINLIVPGLIAEKPAAGPHGKPIGKYGDFTNESHLLASQIIEIVAEESSLKPLLNPRVIVKISNEALANDNAKTLLLKAHSVAAEKGILYFATICTKEGRYTAFSGTGTKFEADLTGDWETDTLRTGCVGMVTINLPRIVHESETEKNKFFEILKERYELATRALEIKQRALRQREKAALPFLTQNASGDKYFRVENCSNIISIAGFREAVETFCEQSKPQQGSAEFTAEIAQNLLGFKTKVGRKHGKRFFPVILQSVEASERLAQLDIEKYGLAKVKFSGTRDKPFYSTTKRLHIQASNVLGITPESLETAEKLKSLSNGGNLTVIELEQAEYKAEDLLNLTTQLVQTQTVEFFTYNRAMTYCSNCDKSWLGTLHKCPQCGAISTLTVFDRFSSS